MEGGETQSAQETDDPLSCVEDYLHSHKVAPLTEALRFGGGLVGYFGYDLIRTIEPVLAGSRPDDLLGLPDLWLLRSTELIMLDNQTGQILLIVNQPVDVPEAYAAGCQRLQELHAQVEETPEPEPLVETPDQEILVYIGIYRSRVLQSSSNGPRIHHRG